jgi:hypothetical protein
MARLKPTRGQLLVVTIVLIGGALVAWLWRLATNHPEISFLEQRPPAEWILYPKPPTGFVHRSAELSTVFRETVVLKSSHGAASLAVRAMRRWSVSINGSVLESEVQVDNWKGLSTLDVSRELHEGTNDISVTVFNSNGPPALWLVLDTWQGVFASGPDWEASLLGASWEKARVASRPPQIHRGNRLFGGERPLPSLARKLPILLVFAALAACLFAGGRRRYGLGGEARGPLQPSRFAAVSLSAVTLLWVLLFLNNLGTLSGVTGFDASAHLEYIDYIKTHWKLPRANEGWQMYQPPLYYVIGALLSVPFSGKGFNPESIAVLRGLGLVIGIVQFTLVFLSLRLLFPGRLGLQLFGLLLAAFLPESLYVSHYITNEGLSAALTTAAVYFCLRVLKSETESPILFAGLAVCLGAALLTKFTGVLAVPFIGLALLSRTGFRRTAKPIIRPMTLCWTSIFCLAICGWHYLRVWRQFGHPLLGNWDPVAGFNWWMEDGFHTPGYFFRAGAVLSNPWHCGFSSFFDGLYSTLWGDGLWGGVVSLGARPPWNYELMAAGFLLALFPMALIAAGSVVALKRFVARPQPEWFLLLGLAGSTFAALLYMNLRLPFCGQAKAFYGMTAVLPLCAFGVLGWETLLRQSKAMTWVAVAFFGAWAMNSYASYWVNRRSPDVQVSVAYGLLDEHREEEAEAHFREALRLGPRNLNARRQMAARLLAHGKLDEATQMVDSLLKEAPQDAEGHFLKSLVLEAQNESEPAVSEARLACGLAPEHPGAHLKLCQLLAKLGGMRKPWQRDARACAPMRSTPTCISAWGRSSPTWASKPTACCNSPWPPG